MQQISRQELRSLEKELELLEQQAINLSSSDSPDEAVLFWVENRTLQIKHVLGYEEKKARFTEKGLALL